jgi:hypothetical protein
MRWGCLVVTIMLSPPLAAQDVPQKPAAKKAAAKKKAAPKPGARAQPTPEQIRRFNELEKKQK